jgi:hypothetical protein
MEEAMKADTPKTYRLVRLEASNFQILKAVNIKVDGTVTKINGRNAQGKSSILDAVAAALGGKDAFPEQPVRKGEDSGEISLDFGGLKLTRKFWNKDGGGFTQSLRLEYADGRRPKEPQAVLDTLRGSPIADDPIVFSRLKPKERYDLLKGLIPDFDFDDMAERRANLTEDRTIVGRDLAKAKGAAASIVVDEDAPLAPIDMGALASDLQAAIKHNADIDARVQRREGFADELEAMRDRADRMRAELKTLDAAIASREKTIDEAEELPAKIDVDKIQFQMGRVEDANAGARKRVEKAQREAEVKMLSDRYEALTGELAGIDQDKADAIRNAELPVAGLTFGEDDIMLDGLPFDQASTARKIRTSTALLMAMKPDLRVLLVREGSLLDEDARAALEADAKAHDFVVLMECVGAGDGSGIVIENGEIV